MPGHTKLYGPKNQIGTYQQHTNLINICRTVRSFACFAQREWDKGISIFARYTKCGIQFVITDSIIFSHLPCRTVCVCVDCEILHANCWPRRPIPHFAERDWHTAKNIQNTLLAQSRELLYGTILDCPRLAIIIVRRQIFVFFLFGCVAKWRKRQWMNFGHAIFWSIFRFFDLFPSLNGMDALNAWINFGINIGSISHGFFSSVRFLYFAVFILRRFFSISLFLILFGFKTFTLFFHFYWDFLCRFLTNIR